MNSNDGQQSLFGGSDQEQRTRTISGRVSPSEHREVEAIAKRAGVPVGTLVRERVLAETTKGSSPDVVLARLAEIENQIVGLRSDLILTAEVLLFAGGKFTPEQARAWILEKLNSPAS